MMLATETLVVAAIAAVLFAAAPGMTLAVTIVLGTAGALLLAATRARSMPDVMRAGWPIAGAGSSQVPTPSFGRPVAQFAMASNGGPGSATPLGPESG